LKKIYSSLVCALAIFASPVWAAEEDVVKAKIEAERVAAEVKLEELFSEVTKNPEDLELNFKYAQLASKLGKFDEAIAAYERMLIVNPNLNRVKLDMALVYMKSGSYGQAKGLFEEVMSKDPPQTVKDNINSLMTVVRKAEKKHHFNGSMTFGFNSDSNASATPATGAVDLFGVSVPLDDSSRAASDDHRFLSVAGTHTYILPSKKRHIWKTDGTIYKTHQSSIGSLDLTVFSLKTGPTFNIPKIRSKLGFSAGYSDTHLARRSYLETISENMKLEHFMTPKLTVNLSWAHENRRFKNSPSATTYELRNGHANEQKFGATISLSKTDIITTGLTLRQEMTKTKYNDNRQESFNISHTHLFPDDYFLNTSATIKRTHYKGIDVLVNPSTIRSDLERNINFVLGKKLSPQLTGSVSYQWRNIDSSIQNYKYKNERVGANLSYSF
jgi:tetratricopeptide (TPR) repeat protein